MCVDQISFAHVLSVSLSYFLTHCPVYSIFGLTNCLDIHIHNSILDTLYSILLFDLEEKGPFRN